MQNRSLSKLELVFHLLAFDFRRLPLGCLPFDVKKNNVKKYKTEAYQSWKPSFVFVV